MQTARVTWRTLRLRCANCGRGKVLRSYGSLHNRCSTCGLGFWRGEEDYFSGALRFALEVGVALMSAGLFTVVALTWPVVPWSTVRIIGLPLLIVAMIGLYPVSRVVWIAIDVLLHPAHPSELGHGLRLHRS